MTVDADNVGAVLCHLENVRNRTLRCLPGGGLRNSKRDHCENQKGPFTLFRDGKGPVPKYWYWPN
jgi:hypothetical protein